MRLDDGTRAGGLLLSTAALFAISALLGGGCSSGGSTGTGGTSSTSASSSGWTGLSTGSTGGSSASTSSSGGTGGGGAETSTSASGSGGATTVTSSSTGTTSSTSASSSSGATTTTSSSGASTTSSSSGTSGASSTSSSASTTSSSSSTSASSSSSSGAPVGCTTSASCSAGLVCLGGACLPPTVLLLAGSATGLLGGTFHVGGAWATSALGDGTSFGTSLTMDSAGRGVGVYTSKTGGLVGYTVWSGDAWSAPAAVPQSLVARDQPFADATGSASTQVVYQDATYHFWFLGYTSTWSQAQAVGTAANQNFGPVPATVATLGANATAAFIDGASPSVNYAASADRTGSSGTWAAQLDIAGPESFSISPVVVPLGAGPELMMVFVTQGTQVMSTTRTAGTWSTPAAVTSALTSNRVALAPLPGGGAILAFRGTDTKLYWSTYSGGAWSTVAAFASPNVAVDTSPAVTHGVAGDTAEIAYVSGGAAYHARLSGSTWSAPALVGGSGLVGVAIAAVP